MDFERVLTTLLSGFEAQRIRYGVIGGFALGLLGVPRATMDLDFLVHRDDLQRLHQLFSSLGYQRDIHLENVSQYYHPERQWGSIDIIHAFRPTALEMLDRVRVTAIPGADLSIRVLQPEDVIGFKVQAMANNPSRRAKEIADIEALAMQHGHQLDWGRVQRYYELFELGHEGKNLRGQHGPSA